MGLYEAIYASDDITVHDVQHEQIVIELSLPGGGVGLVLLHVAYRLVTATAVMQGRNHSFEVGGGSRPVPPLPPPILSPPLSPPFPFPSLPPPFPSP